MTSRRLAAYLELERQVLSLDAVGDPLADRLRDAMDPLWFGLSDEEHALLDSRVIADESDVPLKVPAGRAFYLSGPISNAPLKKAGQLRVPKWEYVA